MPLATMALDRGAWCFHSGDFVLVEQPEWQLLKESHLVHTCAAGGRARLQMACSILAGERESGKGFLQPRSGQLLEEPR